MHSMQGTGTPTLYIASWSSPRYCWRGHSYGPSERLARSSGCQNSFVRVRRRIRAIARDSLSLLDRHHLAGIDIRELVDLSARPLNFDCIRFRLRAQTERKYQFAL